MKKMAFVGSSVVKGLAITAGGILAVVGSVFVGLGDYIKCVRAH